MRRFKEIIFVSLLFLLWGMNFGQGWPVEGKQDRPDGRARKEYIGSDRCAVCHVEAFALWKNSLHSKMYQKPDKANEVILGDFSIKDPLVTFKKEDIAYTIGSRWEQLYAANQGGEDRLLPAKWLVRPRKWAPLDAEHAQRPMVAPYCHGCHTTSFDPKTNQYAEMNVGCEACHGPGSAHAKTAKKNEIVRTQNPEVCGRCHTRGKDVNNGLDFVVKFDPMENKLSDLMVFSQPERKTTRNWWANAVERDRHQEYLGYLQSGHAKSLETLKNLAEKNPDKVTPACYACHSSEYNLAADKAKVTTADLKHGVTCLQCHDPHGRRGTDVAAQKTKERDTACLSCHFVRGLEGHLAQRHHYPCPPAAASCVDCHMPVTGITAAEFNIRSHTLKIITPQDAERLDMPSSCNNGSCHSDKSLTWLKEKFDGWYANRRR